MNVHTSQTAAPKPLMSERRVSLLGAVLVTTGPLSMSLYTPSMTQLVDAFGTTDSMIKLTLSFYFAGFAITQLICGPLSDGYGRKPVTMAFMSIYLVASVLALLAPTVELLIAARFLQGVGAAVGVVIARAIVRDLFTHESSARIMNLIGLIMGVGPALGPTIGGFLTVAFGWQAAFVAMATIAVVMVVILQLALVETVKRDPSRIRPRPLARSYATLLTDRYFLLSNMVIAGGIGAFYTQATVLPFVLMDRVGMTPSEFGFGMLMQSGSFFFGALAARSAMARYGAFKMVPIGLGFVLSGSVMLFVSMRVFEVSFLSVMTPVAIYAFGISFIMPAMTTASVGPYPHMAGAASAMSGFIHMISGLLGGLIAAALGDPMMALNLVIPCMGLIATVSWLLWRRMPEPALANVVLPRNDDTP